MSQDHLSQIITHIRNASLARHAYVTLDATKASYALARILKQNGYILGFKVGLDPNPTRRALGQNQKAKQKLRLQTQVRTLFKIERKLVTLLLHRRKLKSKLNLAWSRARKKVKKGLRRARFLRHDVTRRKRGRRRGRKVARDKFGKRTRPRLVAKARRYLASKEGDPKRTSVMQNSGLPRSRRTHHGKVYLRRRRPKQSLQRVSLKHTPLQRVFKRRAVVYRRPFKRPKAYHASLRLNARLCWRLHTQASLLRRNVQKTRLEVQTNQVYSKARKQIQIGLKYFGPYRRPALTQIKRVSRPSLRCYTNFRRIRQVHGGMGLTVLSTSQGLMSHLQAQRRKLGGETIVTIW